MRLTRIRSGAIPPFAQVMQEPSITPPATASGTTRNGRAKSIGTSTSWVGTEAPVKTSNSTRETIA